MFKFLARTRLTAALAGASVVALTSAIAPAYAQEAARAFDIPAQSLASALVEYSRQAGTVVVVPGDLTAGKRSPAVQGVLAPSVALERLLAGSGLQPQLRPEGGLTLVVADNSSPTQLGAADSGAEEEIVVTGTNIRGHAPVGSSLQVLDAEDIQRSGYGTTQELIQALPQNTRGGAQGATADGYLTTSGTQNVTAASAVNLRGLGSKATLTLLNSHRMAPVGLGGFTDISVVPPSAIERIEVLTDGASAIYGSDAIGGVVNIILRDDYEGAETRARYGFTTQPGYEEYRVGQTFGTAWSTGHVLFAGDYYRNSQLLASDRDFASAAPDPASLVPETRRWSGFAAFDQKLTPDLSIVADAQLARNEVDVLHNTNAGRYLHQPAQADSGTGYAALLYERPSWSVRAFANHSVVDTDSDQEGFTSPGGSPIASITFSQNFRQRLTEFGVTANGDVVNLPGGHLSFAVGASHRQEDLDVATRQATGLTRREADRSVDAAFAELYVPLFSEQNSIPGIRELSVSAAVRHDDYSDFGGTTNPRYGIEWSPIHGVRLRGSYNTSFRAPTMGQEVLNALQGVQFILLQTAPDPNGVLIPVAYTLGGNTLGPERATSYSYGGEYTPEFLPGFRFELNYFNVEYRDRIGSVVPPLNVLRNPAYSAIVSAFSTNSEAQAYLQSLPSSTPPTVFDVTGGAFGPNPLAQVRYVVDQTSHNIAGTFIDGLDLGVSYDGEIGALDLSTSINAQRLLSYRTQIASSAPLIDVAGTVGNPAELSIRAMATIGHRDRWSLSMAANYMPSYRDTSSLVERDVASLLTVDANFRFNFPAGISAAVIGTNIFDRDPPRIANGGGQIGVAYDSANASPFGRVIAFELIKRW